ncbi:hypothetical protein tb265_18770 [Gemmatimonadetes bacterium T265]|nr:hypothetical protein tb265_18770 [Gemmatimonadetes bacterium T265]
MLGVSGARRFVLQRGAPNVGWPEGGVGGAVSHGQGGGPPPPRLPPPEPPDPDPERVLDPPPIPGSAVRLRI